MSIVSSILYDAMFHVQFSLNCKQISEINLFCHPQKSPLHVFVHISLSFTQHVLISVVLMCITFEI